MSTHLRFSIVIPMHNEEDYIGQTLEHIKKLAYPKDSYETIVVENGSSDKSFELAKRFEGENIRVLKNTVSGVSAAKNLGIDSLPSASDWVVFLDADTILKPAFLSELAEFLQKSASRLVVGTTSVLPLSGTWGARMWFKFYDISHRLTKTSYSIQIAKRSMFPPLRFDERLVMGEDLLMIAQARKHGKFFFFPTQTVYTSTRRFDKVGYWSLFFYWIFVAVLPPRLQKKFTYKVVR